jgi:hypothetical protein
VTPNQGIYWCYLPENAVIAVRNSFKILIKKELVYDSKLAQPPDPSWKSSQGASIPGSLGPITAGGKTGLRAKGKTRPHGVIVFGRKIDSLSLDSKDTQNTLHSSSRGTREA